jgi:hypothetical protein
LDLRNPAHCFRLTIDFHRSLSRLVELQDHGRRTGPTEIRDLLRFGPLKARSKSEQEADRRLHNY